MNLPELYEKLSANADNTHDALSAAIENQFVMTERLLEKQQCLVARRDAVLQEHADNPKALGANEAAREASLRFMSSVELAAVEHAEMILRSAKLRAEQAKLDWDNAKLQVWLLNAVARGEDNARD